MPVGALLLLCLLSWAGVVSSPRRHTTLWPAISLAARCSTPCSRLSGCACCVGAQAPVTLEQFLAGRSGQALPCVCHCLASRSEQRLLCQRVHLGSLQASLSWQQGHTTLCALSKLQLHCQAADAVAWVLQAQQAGQPEVVYKKASTKQL